MVPTDSRVWACNTTQEEDDLAGYIDTIDIQANLSALLFAGVVGTQPWNLRPVQTTKIFALLDFDVNNDGVTTIENGVELNAVNESMPFAPPTSDERKNALKICLQRIMSA
eukprot:TRINITY_DN79741_c0_g1_i1.p1 TRINITY_DN79741_c0_g1~~TRINITY_DN79741_c0_g1_i1.p1  ORF type:complete len:111 (+),score=16.01 TRINITY_DN79741_c0_g1_i1:256-588(+)